MLGILIHNEVSGSRIRVTEKKLEECLERQKRLELKKPVIRVAGLWCPFHIEENQSCEGPTGDELIKMKADRKKELVEKGVD